MKIQLILWKILNFINMFFIKDRYYKRLNSDFYIKDKIVFFKDISYLCLENSKDIGIFEDENLEQQNVGFYNNPERFWELADDKKENNLQETFKYY